MNVNIAGLDKARVVKALWDNSKMQGISHLGYYPLTLKDCQEMIEKGQTYFDYLAGKVMEVDLSGDEFDPWGYDRDNGEGAAEKAIDLIK